MQFVVQSGGEPGKTYDLGLNGQLSVGRQSANDIVVSDEQVSRRHAEIKGVTGGALVTDLGSSNGTFVNGARVSSPQLLKANDTLQVGTTVLRLVDTDNESETLAAGYDQPAPTPVGNYNSYSGGYDNSYPAAGSQAAAQPANYNSYQQYQQPAAATPAADSYNQADAYNPPPPNSGGYGQATGYDPNQAANYGGYNNQPPAANVGAGGYNPNNNAYQAPLQPYQPQPGSPGYSVGAVATPVATKPKRRLPLPALIAIIAVLAVLIIGGILFVALGKGGGAGDIAQPPNSTKLNVSVDDLKKVSDSTIPADTSGINFVSYSTKDSPETVSKFYQDDLSKKGWNIKQTTSADTVTATKGDQTVSITSLPFAKQNEIDAFALLIPPLKGQLHPGDTLILAVQGPTSKIKA